MRIGDLSGRTGVSQRSLRYYEHQGLLASERAPSGQRHYTEEHVKRVALIKAFLAAGLSTRMIAEMVPCMATPSVAAAHRSLAVMDGERNRISTAIDDLTAARQALDALIDVNQSYLAEHASDQRDNR
ncbi:MerR family transcriptional regulator [Winogradskya consettensis]|uniref:Transcriptional regulator n=2 Tax=Winogradskya consettensis TaxID=113560 RepID=A0A919SZU8_9ACTN|nr:transcriptional regulator [Actinoplanes consettensis]